MYDIVKRPQTHPMRHFSRMLVWLSCLRNMNSYTVHTERITVSTLKMIASISVKMMSLFAIVYCGKLSAMSINISTSVERSEIVRNSLEHFFVSFVYYLVSSPFSDAIELSSRPTYYLSICDFIYALISNMAESWQQPSAIFA